MIKHHRSNHGNSLSATMAALGVIHVSVRDPLHKPVHQQLPGTETRQQQAITNILSHGDADALESGEPT